MFFCQYICHKIHLVHLFLSPYGCYHPWVKKDYTIAISQIEILLYLPNYFTINRYIITFILYLIFMFSNKVKLGVGLNNDVTHQPSLPHPLHFYWINELTKIDDNFSLVIISTYMFYIHLTNHLSF